MSEQPPADGPGPYRIAPVADEHRAQSVRAILAAAARSGTRRAIVMGAGRCQEIPLGELAERFDELVLVDLDRAALDQGLAAADLPAELMRKIALHVVDITGLTETLAADWRAALAGAADVVTGIAALAAVADRAGGGSPPKRLRLATFDLVIASCVLSQLHVPATARAEQAFAERFPTNLANLRGAAVWHARLSALARRMEANFATWLTDLLAPAGTIYLSETVQTCLVELLADGEWSTAGRYRMTPSLDLADDVDPRLEILHRGRWNWVVTPPRPGHAGKLFDVQALTLGKPNARQTGRG